MKILSIIILVATAVISCNSNETGNHENHNDSTEDKTSVEQPENITTLRPAFTSLDLKVSDHIKGIFDHYTHVKTALVNSNAAEAKNGGEAIVRVISDFDKSLLPADQKKAYDKSVGEIREAASKISISDDLTAQRTHFSTLSDHSYELAKSFGAGKTIYHDHCPMAFDKKGAMWLSENKEIKNPYYGEKMMTCGTVEEIIEN